MKYALTNNVYIIEGATAFCIYQLNNKKLYHIDKDTKRFIDRLISLEDISNNFNQEQTSMLTYLISEGIITSSETQNDIKKIIPNDLQIKFAWIEVCDYCNLKCIHCYNESGSNKHCFMSLQMFISVCRKLKKYGINKVQIIGGEPFCNKEIRNILIEAAKYFSYVEVFTNGTLLTEDDCKLLAENRIKVALSVYSYESEQHDSVTGSKGSYVKTVNAIQKLSAHNVRYRIATIHMKGICIGKRNTDLFKINEKKDIIRLSGRGNVKLLSPELLKHRAITKESFSYSLNPKQILSNMKGHQCFCNKIYIAANLDVYPCVMERRFCHGNLSSSDLEQVLNTSIMEYNKDHIESCSICEFRYACFDCRPNTISADFSSKPYYCTYHPENGSWDEIDMFVDAFYKKHI